MPLQSAMATRKRFKLSNCIGKPVATSQPIPRASDVLTGVSWHKPPKDVIDKLGVASQWLMGVDIETNDWVTSPGNKGSIGRFGFYNLCAPVDFEARIVQIGWAFGPPGETTTLKEYVVCPTDFNISEKATKYHNISHEHARQNGKPARDVLTEFMSDLNHVIQIRHGRLVCHHLEFDAGIIMKELLRCDMQHDARMFDPIVRMGLCTMDPGIGRWLTQCSGEDQGASQTMNVLKLRTVVELILPEKTQLLDRIHNAGVDALLHRDVAYALIGLSDTAC